MTKEDVEAIFTYHSPTDLQADMYAEIRKTALAFALVILQFVPGSAEQTLAIRHLQQAVMFANAGIAIHGDTDEQKEEDDIPF